MFLEFKFYKLYQYALCSNKTDLNLDLNEFSIVILT
jgi:hypothetical protein